MHVNETIRVEYSEGDTHPVIQEFSSGKKCQEWLDKMNFDPNRDIEITIYRYVPWTNQNGRIVLNQSEI